ncbi:MAG TPA: hypothetical protein VMR33_14600 [Candidatus Baltobacteraceae bacterium]|nr:hypothetical protein [Candidatus Baltobacteraceae bacterium]
MNVIEMNTLAPKRASTCPALEIRFHFVDGSKETFIQTDVKAAEEIRHQINLSSLFHQSRIIVADDYSKSVFVCSEINRIDFVYDCSGFSRIPSDHADLVELTEGEFNRHVPLDEPDRLERRVQSRQIGDLLVSYLHLRMRGGSHVYVMNEAVIKLPVDSQSFMQRLLSKGLYGIRLREGGYGVLNLQNLIGYTVYPGVPEVPADSWMAQPKRVMQERREPDGSGQNK